MKIPKNILLLSKQQPYPDSRFPRLKFLDKSTQQLLRFEKDRYQCAFKDHHKAIRLITTFLTKNHLSYSLKWRGDKINFDNFDYVITIGGDGTFLEAARNVNTQVIIGLNSTPSYSVGKLCLANALRFSEIWEKIKRGKLKMIKLERLRLIYAHSSAPINCLNDILICHSIPAAMSRYSLRINNIEEVQDSSGIWISTAAGSTGGIHSAGGTILPMTDKHLQYLPRELYNGRIKKNVLKGAVISARSKIVVTSFIKEGVIYIDGSHLMLPFSFGEKIKINRSPTPLTTFALK